MTHDDELLLEEEFAQTKMNRAVAGRIFSYMKPFRWEIGLALFLEIIWVISVMVDVKIIGQAFSAMEMHLSNLTNPEELSDDTFRIILLMSVLFILNCAFRMCLIIYELRILRTTGTHFLNNLRQDIFNHVQHLSMRYFDSTKEGRIICRMDRDVDTLEYPLVHGPLNFISSLFSFIVSGIFMMLISWKLCLAIALLLPFLLILSRIFHHMCLRAHRKMREHTSKFVAYFVETIHGVRVIQGFSRQAHRNKGFAKLADEHTEVTIKAVMIWHIFLPSISACYTCAVFIILSFGGYLVSLGELNAQNIVEYLMLCGSFFWPIQGLGHIYNLSLSAASCLERIFLLLDTKPEIVDSPDAIEINKPAGHMKFENVNFAYNANKRDGWALDNINFDVPAGTTMALVGSTGAGKSSIVNLASRFYEPLSGKVLLDDIDTKDITLHSLHKNIGAVLQDNFLFTGTVMENLRYGNNATTAESVVETAKKLGSYDTIMHLNDGFNSEVHERGNNLSQGERQLICFTRAMVADPAVLILDEATSSVDTITEMVIQKALEKLCENRTTIIVAHRLSTIRNADNILVLEHGKIIERGKHAELLANGKRYAEMYYSYADKGVIAE